MSEWQFSVTIEIPRWGFVKRGHTERIDFISPLPCPFNYGAIHEYVGLDGDYLDALVLGPRKRRGEKMNMVCYGAIGLSDRGLYDDKLICSSHPMTSFERLLVLNFFRLYGVFKRILNIFRGRGGRTACEGWCEVETALARAKPAPANWSGPLVGF